MWFFILLSVAVALSRDTGNERGDKLRSQGQSSLPAPLHRTVKRKTREESLHSRGHIDDSQLEEFFQRNNVLNEHIKDVFKGLDINHDNQLTDDELQTSLQQGEISNDEYRLLMGLNVQNGQFSISQMDLKRGPLLLTVLDAMPDDISTAFYQKGGSEVDDAVKEVFLQVIGRSSSSSPTSSSSLTSSSVTSSSSQLHSDSPNHSSSHIQYNSLLQTQEHQQRHNKFNRHSNNRRTSLENNNFKNDDVISFVSMEEHLNNQNTNNNHNKKHDPLEDLFGEEEESLLKKKAEDKIFEKAPLVLVPKNSKALPGIFMEENNDQTVGSNEESNPVLSDSSPITASSSFVSKNNTESASIGPEDVRLAEGFGDFLKKAASGVMGAVGAVAGALSGSLGGTKKNTTEKVYPKSEYGVPTYVDEECVICQYVVELTQRSLYDHLTLGQGEEYPHQSDLREINQQVMNMPNGRGIVRIVTENTIIAFCDPHNVPEIFYPYCETLWTKLRSISHAIFFQYGSAAVCVETKMCETNSYVNDKTSVHLPSKSKQYNSGRGKCGMMGGVHEDSKGLLKTAMCTAQKMLLS